MECHVLFLASQHERALRCNVCVSTADCWAVGETYISTNKYATLTEQWDGSAWTVVSSPSPSSGSVLLRVTCVSATDCLAVGDNGSGNTISTALIEQWNGNTWSVVLTPSLPAAGQLTAVTCVSPTDCWAVGDSGSSNNYTTLIEHGP